MLRQIIFTFKFFFLFLPLLLLFDVLLLISILIGNSLSSPDGCGRVAKHRLLRTSETNTRFSSLLWSLAGFVLRTHPTRGCSFKTFGSGFLK